MATTHEYATPGEMLDDLVGSRSGTGTAQDEAARRLASYAFGVRRRYGCDRSGGCEHGRVRSAGGGHHVAGADAPERSRFLFERIGARPFPAIGMDVIVPKIKVGPDVAEQTAEGAEPAFRDMQTEIGTIPVVTVSARLDFSIQAWERGMFADATFSELDKEVLDRCDRQILVGSGANGQIKGMLNSTFTAWRCERHRGQQAVRQALPAGPQSGPDRSRQPQTGRRVRGDGPPAGGRFSRGALGTDNTPAFSYKALGEIPVVASANVPENLGTGSDRDAIIVSRLEDQRLYAGPLTFQVVVNAPSAYELVVEIVAFRYVAFSAEVRPESTVLMTGAGLN